MGESLLGVSNAVFERVAQVVGTPTYVYSAAAIRHQWTALADAVAAVSHRVHYSVKANSNLAILGLLRDLGAGVDIVSGGELARVLRAGFSGPDIVFSGVGKTASELEGALTADVGLVNVESEVEFDALSAVAARLGKLVRVGIRVNPDVTTDTHPHTQTGHKGMKFGVPLHRAEQLAVRMAQTPRIRLCGVGMHLGSQITDPTSYQTGAARLCNLVDAIRSHGIDTLESLDIGGGFAVSHGDTNALDLHALAAGVAPMLKRTGLRLLIEPGRLIIGNAGVLLTRVVYRKSASDHSFLIVDAGMNDFMRPMLYQAFHDIDVVSSGDVHRDAEPGRVDVVGPICESGDYQALDRLLEPVGAGGLLAIRGAGAYGFSMSSTYNSRPRAAEVLVDNTRFGIIRRREKLDDLWRDESVTPIWMDD